MRGPALSHSPSSEGDRRDAGMSVSATQAAKGLVKSPCSWRGLPDVASDPTGLGSECQL